MFLGGGARDTAWAIEVLRVTAGSDGPAKQEPNHRGTNCGALQAAKKQQHAFGWSLTRGDCNWAVEPLHAGGGVHVRHT